LAEQRETGVSSAFCDFPGRPVKEASLFTPSSHPGLRMARYAPASPVVIETMVALH